MRKLVWFKVAALRNASVSLRNAVTSAQRIWICLVVTIGLLGGCANLLKPELQTELGSLRSGSYLLDHKHVTVLFKVDHMGFSKFVGRFNEVDASLDFDAADIGASRLEAVINMASVDVNNESFAATLRGSQWFNTAQFPQAVFKTIRAENISGNDVDFVGELTFLGVTRPITLRVHFNGGATNLLTYKYTIGFAASSVFKRSEFGLDKHIPLIGDDVEIEVHAEFMKN